MDPSRRKITKIARNAAHFVQSRAKDQGLGSSEYEVLHCIRKSPGICADEIGRQLYLEKSAVAHLTASLEKKGFIRREVDPGDKRRRLIYPTDKADALKNSRAALEAFYYGWLLEEVQPEKREVFLEVLDRLYTRSKQARREDNRPLVERLKAEETERNEQDERG